MRTARRRQAALVLLALLTVAPLVDAFLGGGLVADPVDTVGAALAAALIGAWSSRRAAVVACAVGAVLLTAANQVANAGSYTAANDLFFFAVLLGGPALAGGLLTARSRQVTELRRLTRLRAEQQDAELRAAALDERNRLEAAVTQSMLQRLGGVLMQASGARATPDGADVPDAVRRLEATARATLDDLREAVGSLRLPLPADEAAAGQPEPSPAPSRAPLGLLDLLVAASGTPVAVEAVVSASSRGPAVANVLFGLALGAPLLVRRTRPLTATAMCLSVALLMSALLTPVGPLVATLLPLSLLTFAVGAHPRGVRRVAGLGLLLVGAAAVTLVGPVASVSGDGLVPSLIWVGVSFAAGMLAGQHTDRAARLGTLLARLESGADAQRRLAVAEERQALAGDLHDTVAHAMTVVCLHAEAVQRQWHDVATVQAALATIEAATRDATTRLRGGLATLESGDDLLLDVTALAASLGVPLELDASGLSPALGPGEELVAGRVVREALVNAARHAPGAPVRVTLLTDAGQLLVEVANETVAGPSYASGSGTGLLGLAELVRRHGGALDAGALGDRFRVAARLPIAGAPVRPGLPS